MAKNRHKNRNKIREWEKRIGIGTRRKNEYGHVDLTPYNAFKKHVQYK